MGRMTERIYYVIRRMGPKGVETRLEPGKGYGRGKLTEKTGADAFTAEELCELLYAWGSRPGYAVPIRVKKVPARYTLRCKACGSAHSFNWPGQWAPKGAGFVGSKKECEALADKALPLGCMEIVRV